MVLLLVSYKRMADLSGSMYITPSDRRCPVEIKADELTKSYGGDIALERLSFKFEGPGAVGYLGPNGAGKTTTLKLFAGLIHPTNGRALVDGIDVSKHHESAMDCVSALVETPEPYPHLGIGEFLRFVARLRGMDDEVADKRIEQVGQWLSLELLTKRCGNLSKGHKQRVMLAATLLPDAKIVLLDEPTSGLDPAETADVRSVLKELKNDHLIVMSSHLLPEVVEVCDRVAFINKGKLLLIDTVEAVMENFGDRRKPGQLGLEEAYVRLIRGEGAA